MKYNCPHAQAWGQFTFQRRKAGHSMQRQWPARGRPELVAVGKRWKVRAYSPVTARMYSTTYKSFEDALWALVFAFKSEHPK